MIPTGGIGQQLDQLKGLSIQELMQRQSVDPQLVYALALQEKQKMEAAKERQAAMGMQAPQGTEIEKMEADLASRRAPGVQMAAQRSMPQPQMPQPQMSQGIAGVPSPNMGAVGRAQGGIIGYLEGGDVEGKSAQAPMMGNANQRRAPYLDPALEKFLVALETLNAQKDAAAPQEKDLFEQKIQDLLNTASPKVKRMASESTFGLSKKSGMAMGGEVKRYRAGGDVQIGDIVDGEEIVAEVGGVFMTQADYDRFLRNLDLRKALMQSTNRTAGAARGVDSTPTQIDITRGADVTAPQAASPQQSPEELERAQRLRTEQFKKSAGEGVSSLMSYLSGLPETVLPEQTRLAREGENVTTGQLIGATGQDVAALPGRISDALFGENFLGDIVAGYQGTETGEAPREIPITSGQPAQPVQQAPVPPTAAQRLGSMVDKPSAMLRDNMDERAAQESGIRSALTKAKPVADKIAGILEVLGRGAGASKGFEGAQIVEESRKIREAEADRAARLAEQRALLSARKEELDARNAMAMGMSVADYAAGLTDDAIMMSDEFIALEERLKDEAGFFMNDEEEESINRKLAEAVKTIRQKKLQEYKDIMAQYSGVGGQTGVSTTKTPTSYADYNPTT